MPDLRVLFIQSLTIFSDFFVVNPGVSAKHFIRAAMLLSHALWCSSWAGSSDSKDDLLRSKLEEEEEVPLVFAPEINFNVEEKN